MATLTQSYAEQKLVLTTIEGGRKEDSAAPAPADLPVGIESMQTNYTGLFSGAESDRLPQEVKDKQQEFEDAFLQMQTIATKLAAFQQTISKAIAEQKPPATTWATVVGNAAGSTGPAVPGGAAAGGGGEGMQARPPAEVVQAVEQSHLPPPPSALSTAARTTSPDRGAGGEGSCTTTSSMVETKLQKEKRAEDCTSDELMARRRPTKVAKAEVVAIPMEVEAVA